MLEIYDESTPVKLYANATYGKLTISSDVTNFVPKDISTNITLLRSTKIVYVNTMGIAEFNPIDVTVQDFRTANATVEYKTGALNISGVAGTKFGTFALSESKIIRNEESVLTFDVFSETQQNVNVYIVQNTQKTINANMLLPSTSWAALCGKKSQSKPLISRRSLAKRWKERT